MTNRLNYFATSPQAMDILLGQENYLRQHFIASPSLTLTIWELVKLRVSQINQCAFCIDMHSKDALKLGGSTERIHGLSAWRDMPYYCESEHNALAWAELLTSGQSITDSLYRMQRPLLVNKVYLI